MARRKNVKRIDPRYFLNETVNRNDDGSALEEKRIGSMLDPKTYEHPDPEDPNWPWKPGDSVEGNRPHPYEAEPVLGSLKKRPGESREEYERRIRKGKHRAQYRLPDEGELDPYELEEELEEVNWPWKKKSKPATAPAPAPPREKSPAEEEEEARFKKAWAKTVSGGPDVSLSEEGCPHAEEGDALDISSPGIEVHVDDISNLPPEEAFAAGLAAAKDAIDHMLSVPEQVPPEGEGPLQERSRLNEAEGETPEDVAQRISNMPAMFRHSIINDIRYMAEGSKEMIGYYPHVENHVEFAQEVLRLMGEG